MATLQEIARKAGVSIGTVSRVLNRHPAVTQENVTKVLKTAEKLGYVSRQPLRRTPLPTGNIGLLFLGLDRSLVSLPVIAQAVHGIQSSLEKLGANTLIADLPRLDHVPAFMEQRAIDGVLLKGPLQGTLPAPGTNELCDRLRAMPSVWIMGKPREAWGDHCGPDNWTIGALAAEHLVSKGHRALAFLNARAGHTMFEERQAAFEHHARKLGASVTVLVPDSEPSHALPLQAVQQVQDVEGLLERMLRMKSPPTSVFTAADSMAALLYRACAAKGLRVGKDLAVISCNNEPAFVAPLDPPLTTIDVRAEEIGARAVELLLRRIAQVEPPPAVNLQVEPVLAQGKSC